MCLTHRSLLAVFLTSLALVSGCGENQSKLDSPEAKITAKNAETAIADPKFGISAMEAGVKPGEIDTVECVGGEGETPRGDFTCTATTDTGVTVVCEGQVTNGRVPSYGCSPARLPE